MQVSFSAWFQDLFSNFQGFFDAFWSFFTFFGEEYFFIIILSIIYWAFNKRLAKILAITYGTSCVVATVLKELCKVRRPIGDENIRFVEIDNIFINTKDLAITYSFPSKHALALSAILTSLSLNIKNKKLWIGSLILVILVCLSRIYLGVSFLFDVSIGLLLGASLAYLVYRLFIKIENKAIFIYAGLIILSLIALIIERDISSFRLLGFTVALALSTILEQKFINFDPSLGSNLKKVFRVIIGIIVIVAINEGLKHLFDKISDEVMIFNTVRYFIITMFGGTLYPLIFKKIKL